MQRRALLLSIPTAALLLLAACGSDDGSEFNENGVSGDGKGTTNQIVNSGDPSDPNNIASGGVDRNSACATGTAAAKRGVSYLVFQFDRSGSMGNIAEPTSNISVCKNVLKGFFTDAKSVGFNASLSLFPNRPAGQESNDKALLCANSDYATPVATMQALPSTVLGDAASAVTTQSDTPTLPALKGAHDYAKSVSDSNGGAKVAVVLVTDGQPNACTSSVTNVSDFAKSVKATSPTYVIGIGKSLTALNQIAQAGADRDAFLVDTSNPTLVQQQFAAALDTVKALNAACDLSIPPAPAGQSIDIKKVNVLLTLNGKETNPVYDATCANGGWHYDNNTAPTKVTLCPALCSQVQADPAAKVDLLFGCATAGGTIL